MVGIAQVSARLFERARYDDALPGWPDLRDGADPHAPQATRA